MLKILIFLAASIIFTACSGWLGGGTDTSVKEGDIYVAVSVENPPSPLRATTYSALRLRVFDEKNEKIKDTTLTSSENVVMCGFKNLASEKEYKIIAWTQDGDDIIIHSPDTQKVFVEAGHSSSVVLNLQPRVGSIIVQFANVATNLNIETFFMTFDSDSGKFETSVPRAVTAYVALNRVPYGASGKLSIKAQKTDKTMYIDWDTNFTFRRENVYLELSFQQKDGIVSAININSPYNTVFTAFTDINVALGEEKNIGVLISEFCVNGADNADFVEIANLSDKSVSFNELSIEVIGTSKQTIKAVNVRIGANETFVFGNSTSPNYWYNIDVTGTLSLVSTSSIILIYGDKELLDYVIYFNQNNANNGWTYTSTSARRSWTLKELRADPKHNNFGGNWRLSTEIGAVDEHGRTWYGTPGAL